MALGTIELNIAIVGSGITIHVKAGENAQRQLAQEFVVLSHQVYVGADGAWQIGLPDVKNAQVARYALAIWIYDSKTRRVLQATGGWL